MRWVMQVRELCAAGMGGAAATAVDVGTLVLLVEHGTPVALAAFFAAAAGAVVCFTLNKYIAFRDRTPVSFEQLGRFGIVAVATALLMALAMEVFAVKLRVPYLVAKVICSAIVFVAWTYPAQRRLVFLARSSS
ncbi:MAG TPA: GtrA family protein [Kofleriaceae bacterium]|nr:GtrA family protein [Kofleriaceae bacterium]